MRERLRVLYLLAVAALLCLSPGLKWTGTVFFVQLLLWVLADKSFAEPLRLLRRLRGLFVFVLLSFALFPPGEGPQRWIALPLAAWTLRLSQSALLEGLAMCLRICAVLLAALLVRQDASPGAFVQGLRALGLPDVVARSALGALELLTPTERAGAQALSGAQWRRQARGVGFALRDVLRGNVGFLVRRLERALGRGRQYVENRYPGLEAGQARELGVLCAMSLALLTLGEVRLLTTLPVVWGHEAVLLIPLYLLARELTGMRWGATAVGASAGIAGFLLGAGRTGVFGVFGSIALGLVVDLLFPLVRAVPGGSGRRGAARYALLGALAALGHLTAVAAITLLMGAPGAFYLLALPWVLAQAAFGAASAAVSRALLGRRERLEAALAPGGPR